ncbi:MAG: ABC transporter permease [Chloroflexota bacterium]|nr:ABC transporter permease [Chloroflexota bacterium]
MTAPMPGLEPAARYGEIFDRGYQHYDGPRYGRGYAIWALIRYSMKRALGFKKGWGSKIIPILLYLGVTVPVVVSIGIRAFLPSVNVLDYADYFGFIFVIEGIFVATIAPEMLCGDRRENVLALYFSRAITRADYLLAKLLATAILTLTVSCVPAVILWLGRQLLDDSPLSAMKENIGDLGRIILTGVVIAFYLGAIGLMISSFTGRKSIAVAIIVFGFLIAEAIAGSLTAALADESDWVPYLDLLSPTLTIGSFVVRLFEGDTAGNDLSLSLTSLAIAVVIALCCAVMYWRYVPND